MTPITIGTDTYNLVSPPEGYSIAHIQLIMNDNIGQLINPFTKKQWVQQWAGGEMWGCVATFPPLPQRYTGTWRAFLASLMGQYNVLQLGDSSATRGGNASGTPVVDMTHTGTNLQMSYSLVTRGWTASKNNVLMAGDYIQVGYRLYLVTADVNSDTSGDATLSIWPSIRDVMTDGEAIITTKPQGLFRLTNNARTLNASPETLTNISLQLMEVR